jgi:hypothetical protein
MDIPGAPRPYVMLETCVGAVDMHRKRHIIGMDDEGGIL